MEETLKLVIKEEKLLEEQTAHDIHCWDLTGTLDALLAHKVEKLAQQLQAHCEEHHADCLTAQGPMQAHQADNHCDTSMNQE